MSNRAISQDEVAFSSDATASGGGSSSPALAPALAPEMIDDVHAEKKAVPVISPAPVFNSRTGDVYEVPAETIKTVDAFTVPAGFRRVGARELSFMYSIGVYVEPIDENTAPCKYFCLASTSCRQQKTVIPCKGRDRANVNKHLKKHHEMQGKVSLVKGENKKRNASKNR